MVREMDEHAKIPRPLIDKLFELGVMGVEIPETFGGGGASFFHSVLAVEAFSRVDPSIGVMVDVQNTLVINALLRWGSDDIKRRYLPKMASNTIGAYALSEAGPGAMRSRWPRGRLRAATPGRSPAASCGSPMATKRTCSSCLQTSTPMPATAASPRS